MFRAETEFVGEWLRAQNIDPDTVPGYKKAVALGNGYAKGRKKMYTFPWEEPKPFRKPDYEDKDLEHAVWYDLDGKEGEYAIEVEENCVREYSLIPDADERVYLCVETYLEDPLPEDLCMRAAIGDRQIAERGGEESYVNELP